MPPEPTRSVALPSEWRAIAADDHLRRDYHGPGFDDADWSTVEVPGHWQRHATFADAHGPLLYRTAWTSAPIDESRRAWLVFDGVMYQSDVWFDGEYLGDTEGYFFPHTFEITPHLQQRRDHVVAAEVSCTPPGDRRKKRNLTGVFQDAGWLDPARNPGGIWRPVRVEESGAVRIVEHRVICRDADAERAIVVLHVGLNSPDERDVTVRTRIGAVEHSASHHVAAGDNQIGWEVTIPDPTLWWPHQLGDASLHDVEVAVIVADGSVSDLRSGRIGLRSVTLDNWRCSINGERIFLAGTAVAPTSFWLAEADRDAHERDLNAIAAAGLNLVRVEGHVGRPELYDVADELGLLVWQDLPLQWGYHRSVRRQAVRQARQAVELLGHHPSVIMWCAHNESVSVARDRSDPSLDGRRSRRRRQLLDQELPTYSRQVLDRSIGRALRAADPSRPIIFHGGALPSLPRLDGTDNRLALGWDRGDVRDLPALCAALPRLARFVGAIGAAAVPHDVDLGERAAWPHLDWERLATRYGMDRGAFTEYLDPNDFDDLDSWVAATREYQATVLRFHIETLRRLKYRPSGGFTLALWAPPLPAISTAVLCADRRPLPAYDALVAACRPVIAIADQLPGHLHPGDRISPQIHVVSELRSTLEGARVSARIRTERTDTQRSWVGDVPADSCVRIGEVGIEAPDHSTALTLDLTVSHPTFEPTTVRYETAVIAEHHEH